MHLLATEPLLESATTGEGLCQEEGGREGGKLTQFALGEAQIGHQEESLPGKGSQVMELPRGLVESPFLEISKEGLHVALSDLGWWLT